MTSYYVYIYYIVKTKEVFYVGKGKGNRAWCGLRNKFCEDMKNTHDWSVKIIEENLTEDVAFTLERFYIKTFKEDGNRITNQTDGGEGISGYVMPEEVRLKISISSKLRWENPEFREKQLYQRQHGIYTSDEFRQKMSLVTQGPLNGNYGNSWTEEMKESLSQKLIAEETHRGVNNSRATKIKCVETGEIFDYIGLASEKYNMKSQSSITIALDKPNRTAYGYHWVRV